MLSLVPLLIAFERSKIIDTKFLHGLRRRLAALTDTVPRLYVVIVRVGHPLGRPLAVPHDHRQKKSKEKSRFLVKVLVGVGATNTPTPYYTELPRQAGPLRRQRFAYGARQVIRCTCHVVHADELAVRGDNIRGRLRA